MVDNFAGKRSEKRTNLKSRDEFLFVNEVIKEIAADLERKN